MVLVDPPHDNTYATSIDHMLFHMTYCVLAKEVELEVVQDMQQVAIVVVRDHKGINMVMDILHGFYFLMAVGIIRPFLCPT